MKKLILIIIFPFLLSACSKQGLSPEEMSLYDEGTVINFEPNNSLLAFFQHKEDYDILLYDANGSLVNTASLKISEVTYSGGELSMNTYLSYPSLSDQSMRYYTTFWKFTYSEENKTIILTLIWGQDTDSPSMSLFGFNYTTNADSSAFTSWKFANIQPPLDGGFNQATLNLVGNSRKLEIK